MKNHETLAEELESLIDAVNLNHVLEALIEVCYGKAEHLRSNWQDAAAAKLWEKAGAVLDKARSKIDV